MLGEQHQDVYVKLPETWQPNQSIKLALKKIEVSATQRHRYCFKGYLPLSHFLRLESLLNVSRRELKLYKRSGQANYPYAVVDFDNLLSAFNRLLSLTRLCISKW